MSEKILLDGIWDFFYSPQKFEGGKDELPVRQSFSGKMAVPGYWDDHYELFDAEDFFGLRARFNPDYRKPHFPMGRTLMPHAVSSFLIGTGFCAKRFVPRFAPGSQAVLTVGPAVWGCAVYCNGKFAGKTTGYSTASSYDLTGMLVPDVENEIIIAVCNVHDDGGAYCRVDGSHDGIPFGCRPGQHRGLAAQGYQSERGGIGGGVSLKISGKVRISDWFVSNENGVPHWHVNTVNGGEGTLLRYTVSGSSGVLESGTVKCEDGFTGFVSAELPEKWSDTDPNLYTLTLDAVTGGVVSDTVSMKWGARQAAVSGNRILINGHPVFFRGVTEHCYFAETANAHFDFDQYMADLGVLKKAGFNFIRCHTWCPPEPFYDACDELGIYVQTELPSVYTFDEAMDIFRMIRRHPCAVIFCEGNEKYLDHTGIDRLEKLAALLRKEVPGALFNPQEAIRGVEYGFTPDQKLTAEPFPHDADRLARVAAISDVYGSLGNSVFSYIHDLFPGVEETEYKHSLYQKPCLSHEIGILGGYIDFNLESRYEGTFIGTDMFRAAREHMKKHGVYERAGEFFRLNSRFISSLRKQLIENLRSCPSITGYDFLGGIDTHWHLTGYPCGIFNEFYEEKPGETVADVRRYNSESMLLISTLKHRNFPAGKPFEVTVNCSYFGKEAPLKSELLWSFELSSGKVIASGSFPFEISAGGTVTPLGKIAFAMPDFPDAQAATLRVTALLGGKLSENHWKLWIYPEVAATLPGNVRISDKFTPELLDFASGAGNTLILTGDFPGEMLNENFRTTTSGRVAGHNGAIPARHALWKKFPHEGFADWQFFPMMTNGKSLVYDPEMPEFRPMLELIPPFKLVRKKSLLSEFAVGDGRLIICGLDLSAADPAAAYFKYLLTGYAAEPSVVPPVCWEVAALQRRLDEKIAATIEKAVDAGGRPID